MIKKWKECEAGFTMVEMIITVAIMAILAGASVTAVGMIASGNAKRSAARFNSQLTTVQTETMMKKDPVYLYLYDDNGVKSVVSKNSYADRSALNSGLSSESPNDVGGAGVTVKATADDGSTVTLDGTNMMKFAFIKASGAYQYAKTSDSDTKFYPEIKFSGRGNYKVTLVKMTGKHVVNK